MTTSLNRSQLIAVGHALAELGGAVDSVEVAGRQLDPTELSTARQALAGELARQPEAHEPTWLDGKLDTFDDRYATMQAKLNKYALGRAINRFVSQDPERVSQQVEVRATMADGRLITVPVEVVDRRATIALQRAASITEVIALAPLLGYAAPAVGAIVAGLAALGARLTGRRSLSTALRKSAGKQLALSVIGLVPFVATMAATSAAVLDMRDTQRARTAPTVATMATLGTAQPE